MDTSRTAGEQQLRRLRPFLSPHVWALIASSSEEEVLELRQRDIVVVFCDLRGFTAFVRTAPTEVIVNVLADYHRCVGPVIFEHHGILERFTGDGLMVYFDDAPLAHQARCAVRMAVRMRDLVADLAAGWRRCGYELDLGIGIALGPALLGAIGFDQRRDYAAIGTVTNLASRLCAEATAGQVLVTDRVYAAVDGFVDGQLLGPRVLKGFVTPMEVYDVRAVISRAGDRRTHARRAPSPVGAWPGAVAGFAVEAPLRRVSGRARSSGHARDAGPTENEALVAATLTPALKLG